MGDSPCPADELLHAWETGRREPAAAEPVRLHVAGCARCRDRLTVTAADTAPDGTRSALRDGTAPRPDAGHDLPSELAFLQPATAPDALGQLGEYEVQEVLG